jgi:hypothetical protein
MDDEKPRRQPALKTYRHLIESDDLTDLAFYRELMVREEGERLHRILDEGDVGLDDSRRLEVAEVVRLQRDLMQRLERNLVEDESDLLEGDPT